MDQEQLLYIFACIIIIVVACYLSLPEQVVEGLTTDQPAQQPAQQVNKNSINNGVVSPSHESVASKILIKYLPRPNGNGSDMIQFTPLIPLESLNIGSFNPSNKEEYWLYNGSNISSGDNINLKASEFPEHQKEYFAKIMLTMKKGSLSTVVKITKPIIKPATNQPIQSLKDELDEMRPEQAPMSMDVVHEIPASKPAGIENEISFGGFFNLGGQRTGLQCTCIPMKN